MGSMALVPETKMADAQKQSVLGNQLPGEPRDQCLKLSLIWISSRVFGADSKTRIFHKFFVSKNTSSFSHFHLQG